MDWGSSMEPSETKSQVFASGIGFDKLFWIFVVGCVFGAFYEEILTCVKHLMSTGTFMWELRRGVIYGPFSPIYGAGAVLMTIVLIPKKWNPKETIFYGAILGGVFEYVVCLLQEIFVGTVSWDYSHQFLNIDGRTTIPIMFFWGLLALLFKDHIYPSLSAWIEKIPYRLGRIITVLFATLLGLDMLVSWTALLRQTLRRNEVPAFTPVGRYYDRVYTDEYLAHFFPNMKVPERRDK